MRHGSFLRTWVRLFSTMPLLLDWRGRQPPPCKNQEGCLKFNPLMNLPLKWLLWPKNWINYYMWVKLSNSHPLKVFILSALVLLILWAIALQPHNSLNLCKNRWMLHKGSPNRVMIHFRILLTRDGAITPTFHGSCPVKALHILNREMGLIFLSILRPIVPNSPTSIRTLNHLNKLHLLRRQCCKSSKHALSWSIPNLSP